MNKLTKALKIGAMSVFAVLVIAAPTLASLENCVGEGTEYPNLSLEPTDTTPIRCTTVKVGDGDDAVVQTIYGKTTGDCAKAGSLASNPEQCNGRDLNTMVQTIINAVIFVIGMVSVVMIILGGVSYATSQGDAAKVKKGKDTILYGIIGLVISILAFAIVNFVLQALAG